MALAAAHSCCMFFNVHSSKQLRTLRCACCSSTTGMTMALPGMLFVIMFGLQSRVTGWTLSLDMYGYATQAVAAHACLMGNIMMLHYPDMLICIMSALQSCVTGFV